jgi:hypothetical protein
MAPRASACRDLLKPLVEGVLRPGLRDQSLKGFAGESSRPFNCLLMRASSQYFAAWATSYAGDPPNAALQLLRQRRHGHTIADTVIVELRRPRVDGDTVTFLAHVLHPRVNSSRSFA